MADFAWKSSDTEPLDVYLDSEVALGPLTGTVVFNLKKQGVGGAMIVTRGACEIVDATTHQVRYRPTAAQTTSAVKATYNAEFEHTDAEGVVRTFPSGLGEEPDFFTIEIIPDLA